MATPTMIKQVMIGNQAHVVTTYSVAGGINAVYQVYTTHPNGSTTLERSRPWGTERGAVQDWKLHTMRLAADQSIEWLTKA